MHSPGVERSRSYAAYMPPPQTPMVGTHLCQLGPVQNYDESNQSSHAGSPYLGHSSYTSLSHSSGSSRSQSLAPHGGIQSPHDDYQPLYSALGHNHQMMAHTSFRNSALLQMEQGYDPRDSSHATVGQLVAEVQRLSITTNQLFVTSQDLVASNKKLTIQVQAADEAIENIKQDLLELSDQTKSLKKPQAATKNISNEHPKLKVNKWS